MELEMLTAGTHQNVFGIEKTYACCRPQCKYMIYTILALEFCTILYITHILHILQYTKDPIRRRPRRRRRW